MKHVLLMMAMMLVVGCPANRKPPHHGKEVQSEENSTATKPVKELTPEGQEVVGTYRVENEMYTNILVVLENGAAEEHKWGRKVEEFKWKIINEVVHLESLRGDADSVQVFRIEPNGDLTWIANIEGGKRTDLPKEEQPTFKKTK